MRIQITETRNREIFAAHQHGESIEDLAKRYGLCGETVYQIIRIERHKLAVSVEDFYKEMRLRKLRQQR